MTLISLAVLVLALSTMAQAITSPTTAPPTPATTAALTTPGTTPPTTAATAAPTTAAPSTTGGPTTQAPTTTTTLSPDDLSAIASVVDLKVNITADLTTCCQTGQAATINTAIDNAAQSKEAKCTAIKAGLAACNTAGLASTCPAKLTVIKDLAQLGNACGSCSLIQASTLLMSVMAVMASLWSGRL